VALKALQDAKNIAIVATVPNGVELYLYQHTVGLYWVPGHAGVRGNEIAVKLTRDSSVQKSIGPEPSLGGSLCRTKKGRQNTGWTPAFGNVV